jgi:hypothetical protein
MILRSVCTTRNPTDVGCVIVMISLVLMFRAILGLRVRHTFPCRGEACFIRRAAVERNSLTPARNSSHVGLVCATVLITAHGAAKARPPKHQKRAWHSEISDSQRTLSRNDLRHDILRILNLEETPKVSSAFAIERWRGAMFASAVFL